MLWSTINFETHILRVLPNFLRKSKNIAFFKSIVLPLQSIQREVLYKMQHTGKKIDLEKMLNETYEVLGYDHQDHENTKLIYIDDVDGEDKLFIWQDLEPGVSFLEDDGDDNDNDIFLDGDSEETDSAYSWIVFMPDTISFNELSLRALIDSYRYIGKKYTIEIYTP